MVVFFGDNTHSSPLEPLVRPIYGGESGADPGFSLRRGGGGRKRLCARKRTSVEPNSLSAGVQGPLKGPGSSRVVLMVSRVI